MEELEQRYPWSRTDRRWSPERTVVVAFAIAIVIGAVLLALPIAHARTASVSWLDALFTATSAICVTGLTVQDTSVAWSGFGELVLMLLVQLGGFGFMTSASILGILVSRRIGIRQAARTQAELYAIHSDDFRSTVRNVLLFSVIVESFVFVVLAVRFLTEYNFGVINSLWLATFHAVSAFNHGGFSLFHDSFNRFVSDIWVSGAVGLGVICGSVGAPVFAELRRRRTHRLPWSLHAKVVFYSTVLFLLFGMIWITISEWANPNTLGGLSNGTKLLAGWFQAIMPRSAGFSTIDVNGMHPSTWMIEDIFMFVGGATGSSAGGIKVTTFAVLLFIAIAEVRGNREVTAFRRTIPAELQRVAVTVLLFSVIAIVVGAIFLMGLTGFPLDRALFEAISAYCTVGLSTGITAMLGTEGKIVVIALMFMGRVGLLTLASALTSRPGARMFRYPEESLGVG